MPYSFRCSILWKYWSKLNELRLDKMRIMGAVTNGIGVMPSFEGVLSSEDIEAVAHYVSIASNN